MADDLDHYAERIAAAAREAMEQLLDDGLPVELLASFVDEFERSFAASFRQAMYCD